METLNIVDDSNASIMLLNILAEPPNDVRDFFEKKEGGGFNNTAKVQLIVNGKEISWLEFIEKRIEIREEEINKRVAQKIEKLISGERLSHFISEMKSLEYKLKDAVDKLAGEKLEWDEPY